MAYKIWTLIEEKRFHGTEGILYWFVCVDSWKKAHKELSCFLSM